ncbi:MAG TPA: ABC transporter permease [Streptosporangiaceae bacterium]|jgi:ABC-2 type transport system permease protein|nr:ABC transporter permease [Streptosporangiaceae bacterium]
MTQALPGERPGPTRQAGDRPVPEPAGRRALPHPALTVSRDALRAEWLKLRTVSSSAWLLAGVVALTLGVGAAVMAANRCPAGTTCQVDTVKLSLTGIQAGQVVVAVLAVLAVTSEYSTGMIRTTLTAMPRRGMLLAAKSLLIAVLVLAAAVVAVGASMLAGWLILPDHGFTAARGFTGLSLADGPVLRATTGSVLYLGLIALLSLGIGTLVRDSAVAIGTALGLLYLFPVVEAFVSNPVWQRRLERYSPMAGLNIQATTGLKGLAIGPWAGLGVLAIWTAVALLAGGLVMALRDA